jgi:hypothetical protein
MIHDLVRITQAISYLVRETYEIHEDDGKWDKFA